LPENIAQITAVQSKRVDDARRRKTCALLGDGVALTGSGMSAKISRRCTKSQRDLSGAMGILKSRLPDGSAIFYNSKNEFFPQCRIHGDLVISTSRAHGKEF
jgi:hypothetical protein